MSSFSLSQEKSIMTCPHIYSAFLSFSSAIMLLSTKNTSLLIQALSLAGPHYIFVSWLISSKGLIEIPL